MSKRFREKIEEALRILIDEDPEGANFICANWVIVTEWADYEGTRYLHTEVSDAMTPWNAHGMMRMAEKYNSEILGVFPEVTVDEEEDEGDE